MTKKYERTRFDLEECKVTIDIQPNPKDVSYGTAYLNIKLPDGRWLVFEVAHNYRVPLFEEA